MFVRIGRIVRTLRRRRGWRQVDLGRSARVSQQVVSLVECGRGDLVAFRTLERVLAALEADASIVVRWRGGELDRVIDAAHARIAAEVARRLEAAGWVVRAEVSYTVGPDRGSIDLVAFHAIGRRLLIVEIKSELTSVEATLRKHDEKVRLGPRIVRERFGWDVSGTASLLVLPRSTTARRRIAAHASLFERAYPLRGASLGAWLRRPTTAIQGGLLFVDAPSTSVAGGRRAMTGTRRVRATPDRAAHAQNALRPGHAVSPAEAEPDLPPTFLVGGAFRG